MTRALLVLALTCVAPAHAQLLFEPFTELPSAPIPYEVLAQLVDDDPHVDVITSNTTSVVFAFGAGGGVFGDVVTLTNRAGPVALGDMDGDGIADLVHFSPKPDDQALSLSRGRGNGAFDPPEVVVPAASQWNTGTSTRLGDVNDDGHLDIAFTRRSGLMVQRAVVVNDGAGSFTLTTVLNDPPLFLADVELLDIDGDGFDDLVSVADAPLWERSLGDGTFAPIEVLPGAPVGDVLGDARVEIAEVTATPDGFVVTLSHLEGDAFVPVATTPPYPFACGGAEVEAYELSGADRPDIVVQCFDSAVVFRPTDATGYALAGTVSKPVLSLAGGAADIDGDGRTDVLATFLFDGAFVSSNATYLDDEPFFDLGHAVPGDAVYPLQILSVDDDELAFEVVSARPDAPAFLVYGGSALETPFAGGVLVPSPDRVQGPFMTSPLGTLAGSATDAVPLGIELFAQWWIVDDVAPGGFAATTAVRLDAR